MGRKLHVAMFCADAAYLERQAFYSMIFGKPSGEGAINDGMEGHIYNGSTWDVQGHILFALLRNPALPDSLEQLAHIGIIFDNEREFEAEIQRRGIDAGKIKEYPEGHRQVFESDDKGVEWEFLFKAVVSA